MVCHDFKTIFIHIPKTAGQSIETVFLEKLGLSWNNRMPLLLLPNTNLELGPPRLAHLTAHEYVFYHYLSNDLFTSYFKFSFVRNPWDRSVSLYRYMGYSSIIKFQTFVERYLSKMVESKYYFCKPQINFLTDNEGNLCVDFVGRFENLQQDFNAICSKINFPSTELPHLNKSINLSNFENKFSAFKKGWIDFSFYKPSYTNYKDYYNSKTESLIADLYQSDIKAFGYRF